MLLMVNKKTKRIIMSQLPISQRPISLDYLRNNVIADMKDMGYSINELDFMKALYSLKDEQVLVFFDSRKDSPVIATQYGFRIYGTE